MQTVTDKGMKLNKDRRPRKEFVVDDGDQMQTVTDKEMKLNKDRRPRKEFVVDDGDQLLTCNPGIPMNEKLKIWWQCYVQDITSSEKKKYSKATEMLAQIHQNDPQQLSDLFNTYVVMPLKKHDCVGEVEFKFLSAILDNHGLGRDILWTLRTTIYEQLLAFATQTLEALDLGNTHAQAKLHTCIRSILKMEQCHFHNWTVERKDKPIGELEQYIRLVLLRIVLSKECESESCLLAGTAFGFFLHSFCDSSKGLELFLSAFPLKAALNGIKNFVEKLSNLNMNDFKHDLEMSSCTSSIFLLHGLLACGKTSILLDTFPSSDKPFVIAIIPTLIDLCNFPNQNVYHTFSTLVTCLQFMFKNVEVLHHHMKNRGSTFVADRTTMISLVDMLNLNWSNPIMGVKSLARDAFKLLLEIHCAEVRLLSDIDHPNEFSIDELFDQIMCQSWTVKSKYPPLAILVPYIGLQKLLSRHPSIIDDLSESLSSNSISAVGGEVYRALIQQLGKENEGLGVVDLIELWREIFLKPLLTVLYQNNRISHRNAVRHMLVPNLKLFPFAFDKIWFHINQDGCPLTLLVTILRLSRVYGIRLLNDTDFRLLNRCLNNEDEVIREEAFAAICTCSKKAEPLSLTEIGLLKDFITLNLNVDCVSFRQQLICNFKVLLVRLRNSCLSRLTMAKREGQIHQQHNHLLLYSMDFLDYVFHLILRNLSPGGCYQRRHTCLLLLKSLVETFCVNDSGSSRRKGIIPAKTPALLEYFEKNKKCAFLSSKTRHVLLACILDYMDEIKDLSLYLLNNYFDQDINSSLHEETEKDFFCWALKLCCSPKTTCCQSGARFVHYLFSRAEVSQQLFLIQQLGAELQKHLASAKEDLLEASKNAPMHGLLSALSLLFGDFHLLMNNCSIHDSLKTILRDCIHATCDIITHILNVLGVNADEANAPSFEDMGEAIDDLVMAASASRNSNFQANLCNSFEHQLIQSCCWLSLKEGCLFLGTAVHSLPLEGSSSKDIFLVNREDVERVGDVLISVLLTCRHRGAIEACSMRFELFCKALTKSCEAMYVSIVHNMLVNALKDVASLATLTSVTRRSAGLPLLIQTITSSEPVGQLKFLFESLTILLALAKEPLPTVLNDMVDLPQTRALHILRALIHDSRFSQDVLPFLNEVVIVCLDSFLSPSWAVRNAGLQLFGGLIPRLLGQKKVSEDESGHNRIACNEFFTRWPKLGEFLISELEKANPDNLRPTILPILSLLGRLAPGSKTNGAVQTIESSTIVRAINPLLGCPIWHVRKMAARDIATLLTSDCKAKYFRNLCQSLLMNRESANLIHGNLLLLKALLENTNRSSLGRDDCDDYSKGLVDCVHIVPSFASCPTLQMAGMDVILAAPHTLLPIQGLLDMSSSFLSFEPGSSLWIQKLTYWRLIKCPEGDIVSMVDRLLQFKSPQSINTDEFEAVLSYLRNVLKEGNTSRSFWSRVQNLLCPFLAHINLPALLLLCQQLISDICILSNAFPDAVHFKLVLATSKRMASGDHGASVQAASVILWAIAIKINLPETFLDEVNEDCIGPWTSLIHFHASPRMSELFRLSVAKALNLCGVQVLESVVKLEDTCLLSNMESCILKIFDTTMLLLQDELVDVRKETSNFVSILSKNTVDGKIESVHSNLAIKHVGSYFIRNFHALKGLGKFIWEKLSCRSQLEFIVSKWADETSKSIVLFEQEDVNVYAEKCFMTRFYVDILKDFIEKDAKVLQQLFNCQSVVEILNSANLVNTWLESQRKHGIGVLEIVIQTKISPHLCNLSAQLEVLQIYLKEDSNEKNRLGQEYEKLHNIIKFIW